MHYLPGHFAQHLLFKYLLMQVKTPSCSNSLNKEVVRPLKGEVSVNVRFHKDKYFIFNSIPTTTLQ